MSEEEKRAAEPCEMEPQEIAFDDGATGRPAAPSAQNPEGAELVVDPDTLLEMVLVEHAAAKTDARPADALPARIDGVVVGRLVAIDGEGAARVSFLGHALEEGIPARSAATLDPADIGREVALMFEQGDPRRPLIMAPIFVPHGGARPALTGERLELTADKEIVLRCGKASITLTRAGKILIRGAYVLARSSGVHRIQGGSVQIN